jgi:hypothetical protein
MGGSHGRRKQKHDHDGRRSHNARKSLLHCHAVNLLRIGGFDEMYLRSK